MAFCGSSPNVPTYRIKFIHFIKRSGKFIKLIILFPFKRKMYSCNDVRTSSSCKTGFKTKPSMNTLVTEGHCNSSYNNICCKSSVGSSSKSITKCNVKVLKRCLNYRRSNTADSLCCNRVSDFEACSRELNLDQSYRQYPSFKEKQTLFKNCKRDDFEIGKTIGTGSYATVCIAKFTPNNRYFDLTRYLYPDIRENVNTSFARYTSQDSEQGYYNQIHDIEKPMEPNEKIVSLKILSKNKIIEKRQLEHVKNEKNILSTLKHPFIVGYLGSFQDTLNLYFILEFVPGGELFTYLRRMHTFPPEYTRFYASQVLLALDYLHMNKLVYRDLKPENILLDIMGYIRLVDFGFAKRLESGKTYTVCGTCDYLAPEIFLKKGHDFRADFYSFGVFLYELLTGVPPFYSNSPQKTYKLALNNEVAFGRKVNNVSRDIIKNLLRVDPSKRLGNNVKEVYFHPFFDGIDFNMLLAKQIKAPIVPSVSSHDDVSNFIKYPESWDQYKSEITKEQQQLFQFF
ncbi:cAMP-dependent protein kinase catalytic subunit beta domain protein [Theileria parva strain Muguga]|uniref:cAMP-dependent protein kinase catalytic subunit, putative n=1 Tax=Theileria parva TaxID=5875 RepID=Q4N4B2_THEPA|nr:cAMP-dependent protein kinase catalytic subunit beta domain protein [Theileria parva strain Muguga]EAN33011.1 cAMP-dependent protein kinase catalytic subunit beta domain protein [Theileria parva strain Muguga]|eukprot:XP_765294.1 cAMP-dependent protein kinase catalytic subunit [Theileria parva strain Muguga]